MARKAETEGQEPVLGDEEQAALANVPNYKDPETRRLIKHWSETYGTVSESDVPVKITEQCLHCGYARDFRGDGDARKKTCLWLSAHDAEHDRLVASGKTSFTLTG